MLWVYESIPNLPGAAYASPFFEERYPTGLLKLRSYQQAQACLSTVAGGLGFIFGRRKADVTFHWEQG